MAKRKLDLLQLAPESWQNRAHDLLRSCGASFEIPSFSAYSFTTCQTTFSVIFVPQTTPLRQTHRKMRPCAIFAGLTSRRRFPSPNPASGQYGYALLFPPGPQWPNGLPGVEGGQR